MPRAARIVVPGAVHHVTQRGNNKKDVFFVDRDRHAYLDLLLKQSQRYGLRVDGYCLMSNHVHLIVVPKTEQSLSRAIGRTHFLYAQHINHRHGHTGHVWQNRFYSCALDEGAGVNALCYVELNPVRAGLVRQPWDYPWSSAAAHYGVRPSDPLLDLTFWREQMPAENWRETLRNFYRDTSSCDQIRRNTATGRPLGEDSFLSGIEEILGRRVRPLPPGRPKIKK